MDLQKIVDFSTQNLSEYVATFIATVTKPALRFCPLVEVVEARGIVLPYAVKESGGSRLNPKLAAFVVISIFLGITINSLIPGRKPGPALVPSCVIVFVAWFMYSTIIHWFARFLGGHGKYLETLSVSLQLFSVIYVISSFVALVVVSIMKLDNVRELLLDMSLAFYEPMNIYFAVKGLLMLIYLPLALRHIHGFGWFRQLFLGTVPALIIIVFSRYLYLGIHVVQAIQE